MHWSHSPEAVRWHERHAARSGAKSRVQPAEAQSQVMRKFGTFKRGGGMSGLVQANTPRAGPRPNPSPRARSAPRSRPSPREPGPGYLPGDRPGYLPRGACYEYPHKVTRSPHRQGTAGRSYYEWSEEPSPDRPNWGGPSAHEIRHEEARRRMQEAMLGQHDPIMLEPSHSRRESPRCETQPTLRHPRDASARCTPDVAGTSMTSMTSMTTALAGSTARGATSSTSAAAGAPTKVATPTIGGPAGASTREP